MFGYLPFTIAKLANLEARLDLRQGKLPVAIVETVEESLPDQIASDRTPTSSNLVRVVLVQKDNIYVLHSTQCRTVGEPEVSTELTEGGLTFSPDTDVCSVIAIPTRRLKSIEYRSVTGRPPPNDTPFLAAKIAVSGSEPFDATVSTSGANDENIGCTEMEDPLREIKDPFLHTIWYEITPSNEGVLLARVDALTEGLSPAIGIWPDAGGAVPAPDAVHGSGDDGQACETRVVSVPTEDARSLGVTQAGVAQRVATLGNLQANETYLIGVGATETRTQSPGEACDEIVEADIGEQTSTPTPEIRTEGDLHVFIQFFPDGALSQGPTEQDGGTSVQDGDTVAQQSDTFARIEPSFPLGRVELEVRTFSKCTYDFSVPEDLGDYRLLSEEGAVIIEFERIGGLEEADKTTLIARGLVLPGDWQLSGPPNEDLVNLVVPDPQPNLIITIEGDNRVLDKLTDRLDPSKLSLASSVLFDTAASRPSTTFDRGNQTVRIIVVQPEQITSEEQLLLSTAKNAIEQRLNQLRITSDVINSPAGTEESCSELCVTIHLVRVPQTDPMESEAPSQDQSALAEDETGQSGT